MHCLSTNLHYFNLFIGAILVIVFTSARSEQISASLVAPRQAPTSCMNEGDGDIYGLGVRIGLYLQWAESLIARLLDS